MALLKNLALGVAVTLIAASGWYFYAEPVSPKDGGAVLSGATNSPVAKKAMIQHRLRSRAGIVMVAETGEILFADNAFQKYPIASLTKLMSAMVALDKRIDLAAPSKISAGDFKVGGNLRIVPDMETVTAKDLLFASITGSANNAAIALAKKTGISEKEFVVEMNRKAVEFNLESLSFTDASGLSPLNAGSAYDTAIMAGKAFLNYPLIAEAASLENYPITTLNTGREHVIKNPNELFNRASGLFDASKTGYLDEALYCLVITKKTKGGTVIALTLGNASKNDGENETLELLRQGEKIIAGAPVSDL